MGGAYCITHAVLHVSEPVASEHRGGTGDATAPQTGSRPAPARFGFIVSKAVGNAVTRNLVRRRLKSIVERRLADGYAGADVVFRALPASATANFGDLEREVARSLDRMTKPRGAADA